MAFEHFIPIPPHRRLTRFAPTRRRSSIDRRRSGQPLCLEFEIDENPSSKG